MVIPFESANASEYFATFFRKSNRIGWPSDPAFTMSLWMGSSAGTLMATCTGMVCLGLRSKSSGVSFSGLIATGR